MTGLCPAARVYTNQILSAKHEQGCLAKIVKVLGNAASKRVHFVAKTE